jgi:hypothetical protein
VNNSAFLTVLGSIALGIASKHKGSVAKLEKRNYKVIQFFKEYQSRSYPEEWDDDPILLEKLLITGNELGFDEIDFITIENWFVDSFLPNQLEEQYSIDRYAIDIHVYIKKDTLIDQLNYPYTLVNRESINKLVRKIEPRIMSMAEELILKPIPKESILDMPYYISDYASSREWHQPEFFETRESFVCVEFFRNKSFELQFYIRPNKEIFIFNGKPFEFYKPIRNQSRLRKR